MFFLAVIYLALPVFISIFSLFNWPFVVGATIALAVLIFDMHRQLPMTNQTPMPPLRNSYPLIVITVLLVAVGVIDPYPHWDWEKSFGVFNLLRDAEFPPIFTRLDGELRLLRYYLGWYAVPSLTARFFGDFLLTPIMFLSTAFGMSLALLMAFAHLKKRRHFLVVVIVFWLFSGLDIVGAWLTGRDCCPPFWPYQYYTTWGVIPFQLSGTHTYPQHAIPAWLAVGMLLSDRRLTLQYGVLIGALVLMWSPIVAIGLIPIYAYATIKNGIKSILTPANTIAAPLVALPLVFYLTQGTSPMPFAFIWEVSNLGELLTFWAVDFAIIALAIYQAYRADTKLLWLSVLALMTFSLISYGVVNDFIARVSIPYIFILSVLAGRAVIASKGRVFYVLITYLSIGAFPVIWSLYHSITHPRRIDKTVSMGKTEVVNRPGFKHQHSIPKNEQRVILGIPLMRSQN